MAEMKAIKAIIHGRVQGVFFRGSTRRRASELELSGTVRNLPDRRNVEVHAEGEKERLESLIEYLNVGPPGANVEKVDVEWSEYNGRYKGFSVIY
jgi:acylphosphatase